MLENDGVGARSGISKVCGSARSQKKLKLRCSTSSRRARSSAGAAGAAAILSGCEDEPAQAMNETARRSAMILLVMVLPAVACLSEVDLQPDLLAAAEIGH